MAKGRVGVLEANQTSELDYFGEPLCVAQHSCGRAIAEYMIATGDSRRIGKRLIQMIHGTALAAIKEAKLVRDLARVKAEVAIMFWDGPLGIGQLIPFSRASNPLVAPDKLHYEMPHAGDRGTFARHRRHLIVVSARNLFARQIICGGVHAEHAIARRATVGTQSGPQI
jgi:hypothetical protein